MSASALAFAALNVATPFLAFFPQVQLLRAAADVSAFSLEACKVVIVAHFIRLLAWKGTGFHASLAAQSVAMIALNCVTAHLFFRLKWRGRLGGARAESAAEAKARARRQERSFFRYLAAFCVGAAALLCPLYRFSLAPQIALVSAVMTEALVPAWAYVRNEQRGRVKGASLGLILAWVGRDAAKLYLFAQQRQPAAFFVSTLVQLVLDYRILCQFARFFPAAGADADSVRLRAPS